MRQYKATANHSIPSNGEKGYNYNPFRRLRRRLNTNHLDDIVDKQDQLNLSPQPANTLAQGDTPKIHGPLFSSSESYDGPGVDHETSVVPFIFDTSGSSGVHFQNKEKLAEANSEPINALRQFLYKPWKSLQAQEAPTQTERAYTGKKGTTNHYIENNIPIRKRRVVVVEYGNTDNVKEVTADSIRQSWSDPEYSEIEVPGYPVDENGQQRSRNPSSLATPLKESLRKFMPQQGLSNLRIFFIQDDREAFLSLGHALNMSFSTHRTNFRAWAVGPSHASEEPGQRVLLEFIGNLYPMQTVFWRPDRTGTSIRTAFGMEYPVLCLPGNVPDLHRSDGIQHRVASLPETSEQRLSVYIQLKRLSANAQITEKPDLGLDENTVVILDSMRKKLTNEELLDGAASWKRLMYNANLEDPLVGNPVLVAAVRLIFDAVAAKWSDYILSWLNYVTALEEQIYSQPANDRFSPLLWGASKRLQQAERLLKFHVLLLENVQHELADITGPGTMEPDWLRQNLKEFTRLSSEVEESLRKPIAQLVDLMYKSISIRDARHSLELNTSLWRLSWITFTFLPLTFLCGFFGMNVSELRSNPSVKWYFAAAVPLMFFVMIAYLSARKLMRKDVDITQPWIQQSFKSRTM